MPGWGVKAQPLSLLVVPRTSSDHILLGPMSSPAVETVDPCPPLALFFACVVLLATHASPPPDPPRLVQTDWSQSPSDPSSSPCCVRPPLADLMRQGTGQGLSHFRIRKNPVKSGKIRKPKNGPIPEKSGKVRKNPETDERKNWVNSGKVRKSPGKSGKIWINPDMR